MVKLLMQASWCFLCQEDRSPATCWLLALLKTKLTQISSICLIFTHIFCISHISYTSRTSRTSCISCNIFVHLLLFSGCIPATICEKCYNYYQIYAQNLTRTNGKRFTILNSLGCNVKAILLNLPDNGQIYARNLTDPMEKDLPYIACR